MRYRCIIHMVSLVPKIIIARSKLKPASNGINLVILYLLRWSLNPSIRSDSPAKAAAYSWKIAFIP